MAEYWAVCGIAGIYMGSTVSGGPERERPLIERMTAVLEHRGPDAEGHWQDATGRCTLGHRRLSIIDISEAGAQPMGVYDSPWVISFNGEIYNYLDLRADLEREGVRFVGRSDTEVLLQAISRWGPSCVERIDGMFAFGAFNTETGELLLARDPFGEKPLYYCDAGADGIAFASELRALELLPWLSRSIPLERAAEMLMFQYVGGNRTIYAGVKRLPPGHLMHMVPGRQPEIRRYFRFSPDEPAGDERPLWQAADELEELLARSLERRLMSDVPLGALLSGGVDSGVACALVRQKLGVPLSTFSLGFRDAPESETDVARAFAAAMGSDHHELIVEASAVDFLRQVGEYQDEPNGDVSCFPTYLLSHLVRQHVTVAISGDGGDEMLGGYGRYLSTLSDVADRPLAAFGAEYYSGRILIMSELEIRALFGDMPAGLRTHLTELREQIEARRATPLAAMRETDTANYLPGAVLSKVDRMSMQHSLEVRTPYLAPDVAAFAAGLPARLLARHDRGKLVLREVAYRYLPRELIDLPKKGFGLPSQAWATDGVTTLSRELLGDATSRLRAALGGERVDHFLHRPYRLEPLWAMVALESWLRAHDAEIEPVPEVARSGRSLEAPIPPRKSRRARWLTNRTLLLVDDDLCEPHEFAEVDGRTSLGRSVTSRAIRTLKALRPLLANERPSAHADWTLLAPTHRPQAALGAAGIDVTKARVLWFRSDALIEHGRAPRALRRESGGYSVSVGLQTWRLRREGIRSEAKVLTGSESLLVVNPLDDSVDLPVVSHHRRLSSERARRVLARRRGEVHHPRSPPPGEAARIVHDVASASPSVRDPGEPQRAVMLVTHALPPGGAERQWCYLADGLRRSGVDVHFVTTHPLIRDDAHYVPMLEVADVHPLELPDLGAGTLLSGVSADDLLSDVQEGESELGDITLRLSALMRVVKPDAALAQLDQANVATGLAGVSAGVPTIVLSFRNYNPDNFSYLRSDWYRASYAALAQRPEVLMSGNSVAGNADYAEWIGIDRSRVHTIPNAISAEAVNAGRSVADRGLVRHEFGIDAGAKVVLGAFRLSEEKRPELFIEACARARRFVPDLQVLVAGVGPLRERVAELVELYGLSDVVQLLGPRKDMADLFEAADVLLMTSRFEGMPNVVLEALVFGLPVVAPAVGAVPEIVESGETGIITEGDAPSDFADALAEILVDPAPWRDRCRAHRDSLTERFSVALMVDHYAQLTRNGRPDDSEAA